VNGGNVEGSRKGTGLGNDERALRAAEGEFLAHRVDRHRTGYDLGIRAHEASDREVGEPSDIVRAADAEAALMEPPGRERITEGEPHDGRGEHHAHHHPHGQWEVAGTLQHEEHHGERGADHRRRHRAHADHHERRMLLDEVGRHIRNKVGENRAEQAAEEERGAEHAAAKAGAQRERRSQQLGDKQEEQHGQGEAVVEHELDGAVPAAQHLRHDQGDGAHEDATHRWPKPLRQGQPAQPALGPGHRLHGQHAEAGRQDAEQGEHQIEPLAEGVDVSDAEQGRRIHQRTQCHRAGERRGGHRCQRPHGVAPEDQLVAVERPGQRRVEGGSDGRGGAGGHEDALVGAAQPERPPDSREDAGAELDVARLHADGDARRV
jgi:hypothetical protein